MRVRVRSKYTWEPCWLDRRDFRGTREIPIGEVVRVINRVGCPKANTMGHCYIESMTGEFLGLVCTDSLTRTEK